MTDALMDTLVRSNPVSTDDVEVPRTLVVRALAPAAARSRRPLPWAAAVAGTALAALIVALALPGSQAPEASDAAARAYAASKVRGIVHWRTELLGYANGRLGSRQTIEGWALGRVSHVVYSDVVRGKAHVTVDERRVGRRSRAWLSGSDDYVTGTVSRRQKIEPIPTGDPLAAFRAAYRGRRLRDLGGGRFEILFKHLPRGSVVYEVDPRTGRPRSLTLLTHRPASLGRPDFQGKTVVKFSTYEHLPVTPENLARLRLMSHPGAGPGREPASRYFRALRTGEPPDPAHAADLQRLASNLGRFRIDPDGIRTVMDGIWILPGRGYVCLASAGAAGSIGASCQTVRKARRSGLAVGNIDGTVVAVPDGVRSVAARLHWHGHFRRYPVRNGVAIVPGLGYQIVLSHRP